MVDMILLINMFDGLSILKSYLTFNEHVVLVDSFMVPCLGATDNFISNC